MVHCSSSSDSYYFDTKGQGRWIKQRVRRRLASGLLGSKTGDFLTWLTITVVGVFLLMSILMAKFYRPTTSDFGEEAPASAATGNATATCRYRTVDQYTNYTAG